MFPHGVTSPLEPLAISLREFFNQSHRVPYIAHILGGWAKKAG